MNIREVKLNLNKKVRYKSSNLGIDGDFLFLGCIIRKDENGFKYTAEIQQGQNSVLIVRLEEIQVISENEVIK